MGLFDFLKAKETKKSGLPSTPLHPRELAHVSYAIAHRLLPPFAFEKFDEFLKLWNDKRPFGVMLYFTGSKLCNLPSNSVDGRKFTLSTGTLTSSKDYYLIEFPEPPPCNHDQAYSLWLLKTPPEQRPAIPLAEKPLIGPRKAAIIHDKVRNECSYFLVEQTIRADRNVFRSYNAAYQHHNLGECPTMSTLDFLNRIIEESTGG